MKKQGIVFKLFLISLTFFVIFLATFIGGQTLFFKKFYLNTKISDLEENLESLSRVYLKESWNSETITKNLNKFADENNAQISVLDETGVVKYTPAFDILLETTEGNVKIPLNSIAYLDTFQNLKFEVNSEIEVLGYFSEDFSEVLSLFSIKNGNEKWVNSNILKAGATSNHFGIEAVQIEDSSKGEMDIYPNNFLNAEIPSANDEGTSSGSIEMSDSSDIKINGKAISLKKITGKIRELNVPKRVEVMTNYNTNLMWSSVDYWSSLYRVGKIKMESDRIINLNYKIPTSNADNIILIKPIIKDNKTSEFLFVVSSLQPVGEAVDVMKGYYHYVFLVAVIIVTIMSLLFSKIISDPLIKMNRIACKMADFDFSEECTIKSKDELGSLGKSLNRLSSNLGSTLVELRAANHQLQLDIEKERNLETMRKEFIASVSHEFKTPLGVIKGFAEGVKDNIAENKKEHYIDVILEEVEKMDELVLDLLELARLESKTQKLNIERFDIIELINEVENRLSKSIEEKNINLKFQYCNRNLQVYGDQRRIEQVITNILSNAIRHTNNERYINIGIVEENKDLYVYIENSGEHIGEEDIIKIWDKFYRTEKSRGRKTGGTGLGLAIVKNILQLHESKFGAENTDIGVKFYFTLKLKE
ncbi:MAG: ATP-binding protein [Clostridiaceae bacterium]